MLLIGPNHMARSLWFISTNHHLKPPNTTWSLGVALTLIYKALTSVIWWRWEGSEQQGAPTTTRCSSTFHLQGDGIWACVYAQKYFSLCVCVCVHSDVGTLVCREVSLKVTWKLRPWFSEFCNIFELQRESCSYKHSCLLEENHCFHKENLIMRLQ